MIHAIDRSVLSGVMVPRPMNSLSRYDTRDFALGLKTNNEQGTRNAELNNACIDRSVLSEIICSLV
jgi:hypothetical protein